MEKVSFLVYESELYSLSLLNFYLSQVNNKIEFDKINS